MNNQDKGCQGSKKRGEENQLSLILRSCLKKSSQPRRRQEKPREMLTPEASEKNQTAAVIHNKSSSDFVFSH